MKNTEPRGQRLSRLVLALLLVGCGRASEAATTERPSKAHGSASSSVPQANSSDARRSPPDVSKARRLHHHYRSTALGPMHVVIDIPSTDRPLPVLVALHGWGEAVKGPRRGARGWTEDYGLPRALKRLEKPPLNGKSDFGGFFSPERMKAHNQQLETTPYEGMIVVMPFTPKALLSGFRHVKAYADFLVDDVLPRVRKEAPALQASDSTGIDGVSLGGRAALLVGFARPNAFGSVASLQAAFYDREVKSVVERGKRAFKQNPKLRLRLLTSHGDGYRGVNRTIAQGLRSAGVKLQFDDVPGPHTYGFNRGPGVYEMLLWHDRALRIKGDAQ